MKFTQYRLSFLSRLHTYLQWRKRTLCAVIFAALSPTFALANPSGAQVISGQVSIDQSVAGITTITNSPSAIINWQDFNIAQNEITRFVQQNGQSAVLNRIIGGNPSEILGSLFSNGKVFLINPNGIVFGTGSQIDTQGLIASSLNLSNSDFQKGNFHFIAGSKAGDISNEGIIHAGKDGNIVLIAPNIENKGIIHSEGGKIVLAAGQELILTSLDDPDIRFQVQAPKNHVLNIGELLSEGGSINVFAGSIKHSGDISADSVEVDKQGNIRLVAKGDVTLEKDSKISTNNEKGVAGKIEITGENVAILDNSKLNANGQNGGGDILIGGDYQGKNLAVKNAQTTTIAEKVEIQADAKTEGKGGKVIVWSDENTKVAANISAKGGKKLGDGGLVETSGKNLKIADSTKVSTKAPKGKVGTWLLDPTDFTIADGGNISSATLSTNLTTGNVSVLSTSGTTGTNGDIFVNAPVSWLANTLTLSAQGNININAMLDAVGVDGIGTGKLALEYGQSGSGGNYFLSSGVQVNLPAGQNFSTKSGTNAVIPYTVITDLGVAGDENSSNQTLQAMAKASNLSGNYVLGGNIDALDTANWNSGAGFAPIGYVDYLNSIVNAFTGNFDGLGHTISNLKINRPMTHEYVGLFGISSSEIKNVGLLGGSVSGDSSVGGLLGMNYGGTVSHSYSTGTASGSGSFIGGLIGTNNSTVSNSYSTGSVSGSFEVGGLIGRNMYGTVSNNYSTGAVSGSFVGGLIGTNGGGAVSNSYSTGAVSVDVQVGGGLLGENTNNGVVTNSFWDTTTSGQATSAGGIGKTTAEMMTQSTFTGFDFTNTWIIADGVMTPKLRTETLEPSVGNYTLLAGETSFANKTVNYYSGNGETSPITGSLTTASNGTFAEYVPNIPWNSSVLTWLSGESVKSATLVQSLAADFPLSMTANQFLITNSFNSPLSNAFLASAKGSLNDADIPYSVSTRTVNGINYSDLTTTDGVSFKVSENNASYNLDGNITSGGAIEIYSATAVADAILSAKTDLTVSGGIYGDTHSVALQANNDIKVGGDGVQTNLGNINVAAGRSVFLDASIYTGGGDIEIVANESVANGVTLANRLSGQAFIELTQNATLDAGLGIGGIAILMRRQDQDVGDITLKNGIYTDQGNVLINTPKAVRLEDATITINGGNISIGSGTDASGYAGNVYLSMGQNAIGTTLNTGTGNINIKGGSTSSATQTLLSGIDIRNTNLLANNITLDGKSETAILSSSNTGVYLESSDIQASGALSIVGSGKNSGDWNHGVEVKNTDISSDGAMTITGTASGSSNSIDYGIYTDSATFISNASDLTLTGDGTTLGLDFEGSTVIGSPNGIAEQTGNINLIGSGMQWVNAEILGYGNLSITPTTSTPIYLGNGNTTGFRLDTTELSYIKGEFNTVSIGAVTGAGNMTIDSAIGFNSPTVLYGDNVLINNSITMDGGANPVTLGNSLTINATNAITANAAAISTQGGAVNLNAENADVVFDTASRILTSGGDVSFSAAGSLTLPTLTANSLTLQYGQSAVALNNAATYSVTAPINLPAGQNFSTKLGSDGTTTNYTVITSLGSAGVFSGNDLQGMSYVNQSGSMSGNYALGGDIDASATSTWNSGEGFLPVGNATTAFTGKFEGLNHTISNLTINRPSTDYVGLFGYSNGSSILKNVGLINGITTGQSYVGGLVGYNNGTVSNSYSTGSVSGTGNYVGGLTGVNGGNYSGAVSNSYSRGAVSGTNYVGGLIGLNYETVSNSYSTGVVSGTDNVSGLVGLNQSGTVINSFWDMQTSGQITGIGLGKTTAEMMSASTLTTLNNGTSTWSGIAGTSYPYLSWQFATAPQILSGTLNGSDISGKTISYAVNGSAIGNSSTGANGYFYQALPANSVSSGNNLLAWLDNATNKGAEVVVSDGGHLTNLSITPNTVLAFSATDLEAGSLVAAKGNLADPDIPYTVTTTNGYSSVSMPTGVDLTFKANDSILADMWTDITTNGGDVVFNANANGVGTGNIQFLADGSGASITTNGGNIIMGGGTACTTTGCTEPAIGVSDLMPRESVGIQLHSATLNSGGGLINLKGKGATGASFLVGVDIQNSTISGGAGDITLQGTGGWGSEFNNGVRIYNATITNTGATTLIGKGVGYTDGANGSFNSGVYLELATLTNGSLNIIGSGGDVLLSGNVVDGNTGVEIWDSNLTTTGAMTITGTGNGTGIENYGIATTASTLKSGLGVLTLDGFSSTNAGLYLDYGTVIGDATGGQTGNIVLIADNDTTATDDAIVFTNTTYPLLTAPNPSIRGTGSLFLQPFEATTTVGLVGGAGRFNLSNAELGYIQAGFNSVDIGKIGSTAALTIAIAGDGILNVITPTLTLRGNVTNDGTIKVGGFNSLGTLNVAGNFSQTANSALNLDLGGTTTGQFDKVTVMGNVALGGALNATLFNNYSPTSNDAIPFLTMTGTASGTFTSVNVPANFYAGYNLYTGEAARLTYSTDKLFTNAANNLNWATAENWTNNTVPVLSDDVQINSGFTVAHASGADSVKSLTVATNNGLNISGGSLTVSGLTAINGALNVTGTGIFTPPSTGITGTGAIGYNVTNALTLPAITANTLTAFSTGTLTANTISTTSDVLLKSDADIILPVSKTITTQGGAVTFNSDADTINSGAIVVDTGASVTTNGGAITLGGGTNPLTDYAQGNAANFNGISINTGSSLNSNGGAITLHGKSYTGSFPAFHFGVLLNSGSPIVLNSGAGNIVIDGISTGVSTANSQGVVSSPNVQVTSTTGNILINGSHDRTNGSESIGVNWGGTVNTTTGNITLNGTSSATASTAEYGIFLYGKLLSESGAITLQSAYDPNSSKAVGVQTGWSTYTATVGYDGSLVSSSASPITINADKFDLTASTFKSSGALTVQPQTANTTIGIAGGAGTLQLPASYFTTNFVNGFSNINIGSASTGAMTLGAALTVPTSANLTLQNAGNMALNGALTLAANKTLTLNSTGTVSQTAPITATNLLLLGAGNYALTNINNVISNLAAGGVGSLSFMNSGALTLGSINSFNGINATGAVDIATYNGDLTVNQPVVTSDTTANALNLNAGYIETTTPTGNIIVGTNGSFSVGTGGIGKFFTGSILGSTTLANFIPVGNFRYNSDESVSNYTATITAAGKYAIYREQPKLRVNPNAATSGYGDTIASLAGTVNTNDYINGDSGGVTGTPIFTTTATSSSHVGNYDVAYASGYSSAVGYGFADDTITGGEYSVTPRVLTPTLTNTAITKIYDQTTSVPVGFTPTYNYNGLASGDTGATVAHSAASYNSADVAIANAIIVSGVTLGSITGTRGSLISDYVLDATSKNVAATITAKALTVTATGNNKVYDASTTATINLTDDRISGDILTTSYLSAVFADKNVGIAKTINVSGIDVTGTDASNYTFNTTTTASADITQAALSITANAMSKTYGGIDPTLTYSTTGLMSGDTLLGSLTRATGENVGGYAISSTLDNPNYAITYTPADFTITAATLALAITADNTTRIYGAVNPTFTGQITTGGLQVGDTLASIGLSFSTTATQFSDVGSYPIVPSITSQNYVFSGTNGVLSITPASLSLTGLSASNKVYDATTNAVLNGGTLAGILNSDAVTLSGSLVGQFADKNVGASKVVAISNYGLTGTKAANYTLTAPTGIVANITPATLNITATGTNKIYDGLTTATVNLADNRISGDVLTTSYTTAAFTDKNVGATKTINVSGIGIKGADASNYTFNTTATASADITRAALSIAANTANKIYGTANPALTYTATGLISGDTLSGSLTRTNGENVGTYAITNNLVNTNYTIAYTPANFTITPAALSISANAANKVYGTTDPALTYRAVGLVNGDILSGSLNRTNGENVGNYVIQSSLTNSNYLISYTPADFTITPAALSITANAVNKVYGNTDVALTYNTVGLISGDSLSGSLSRVSGENVGRYAIQSNLTNDNYTITYTPADFTITPATLNIAANAMSKVYGTTDSALTYSATGLRSGDALTGALTRTAGENVGHYAIQSNLANSNYVITYTPANFSITPAALGVTAHAASKVYGGTDPALTYTATGLLSSDTLTGNVTRVAGENVGHYAIQSNLANSNYTITYTPADFAITPAALNITANAASKVYGSVDPTLTYQTIGLVAGDTIEGSLSRAEGKNVGIYPITGNFNNANYTITYTSADFTITPAALNITANSASKIYGDADPILTYQTVGLVDGDTLEGSLSRAEGKNVGIYPITGNFNNANYTITYTPADFTITPAALSVTANAASKIYGDADPTLTYQTVGLVDGDTLEGSLNRVEGKDVGIYPITQKFDNSNYTIAYTPADFTITPAALNITANSASKIYGDADPELTYKTVGLIEGDTLEGSLTRAVGETVAKYGITGTFNAGKNYTVSFVPSELEITPAALQLVANDKTKLFGEPDPVFDYTVTGLKLDDAKDTVLSGNLSRDVGEEVAFYGIHQGDIKTNSNYTFNYQGAKLEIKPVETIPAGSGSDSIPGESTTDTITSGSGIDTISGETPIDVIPDPTAEAARLEAERLAAEQAKAEAERLAAEQAKAEAERLAAEQAKAEAERLAAEQAKAEAERLAAEQAKAEAERLAAEQAKAEAERLAAEQAKAEAERLAAEQAKAETERLAAEQAKAEAERLAAEQAKAETERLAAEQAKADAERLAAEQAAKLKAEEERLIAEKTATPPTTHTQMTDVVEKLLPSVPKEQAQVIVEKVDDGVISQTNTVITMSAMQMPTSGSSMPPPPPPPPASSGNDSSNAPRAAAPAPNGNSTSTEKSSGSNSASSTKNEKGDKKDKKADVMLVNAPTENKAGKAMQQCK